MAAMSATQLTTRMVSATVSPLLALAGILLADVVIAVMAPGLDGETRALAARLLRIMFPMAIFTASTYTLVGVMQSKGRYLLPAAVSSLESVTASFGSKVEVWLAPRSSTGRRNRRVHAW